MPALFQANRNSSRAAAVRKNWSAALRLSVAALLVALLIWRGDLTWTPLRASLGRWELSLPAVLMLALTPLVQLWRWQCLLRARRMCFPSREVFSWLMIAKFFNMALPSYVGGDVVRGMYVARRADRNGELSDTAAERGPGVGVSTILPSLLFDRLAGVVPLFVLCLAGTWGPWAPLLPARLLLFARLLSAAVLLASLGLFGLAYRTASVPAWLLRAGSRLGIAQFFSGLHEGMHVYVRNLPLMRRILAISFLSQGLILTSFVLFGNALGLNIPASSYFVLAPLGLLVIALPIAPAGLGVGQVAFLALFRGAATLQGANLFTLYMVTQALIGLSGAFFFAFSPFRTAAEIAAPGPENMT